MLAEGCLTRIGYGYDWGERAGPDGRANSGRSPASSSSSSWEELTYFPDCAEDEELGRGAAEDTVQGRPGNTGSARGQQGEPAVAHHRGEAADVRGRATSFNRKTSEVLEIPRISAWAEMEVDLYQSWSTTCQSYTDIQMVGDSQTPSSATSLTTSLDLEGESSNWPFLQANKTCVCPAASACCCEGLRCPRSDTFHQGDRSIVLQREPLSNSVLNNYMEQKITELYKQYLEDNMTKYASPTSVVSSHYLMANIDQISQQISLENNMEPTIAKDIVLNCLRSIACATWSSDITTPILQISNQPAPRF
ncbi:protein CXorf21-like [Amblyraja radiata]|uniref:protein CXorf21-like n=1 Tax=Amblyraja radiata TaxID=386614 RepID=UPI0014026C4A|nr:protein CXorf21-like [Amblyraja radiata]XP_032886707.1 protein CXorf21-like [Amblyraja radiata]